MKKAIIVGGSGSLGKSIIEILKNKDYQIVNVSRTPIDSINIKLDITKNEDISFAINEIKLNHNDASLLIMCPGRLNWGEVGEINQQQIDEDYAINTLGNIKLVNGIISIIKQNKGDIVIVGSTSSFSGFGNDSVYVSAKHAILGFIKSLQAECKKEDVRVIGFHPGGFKSNFHIRANSPLKQEELMDPKDLATILIQVLELPRSIEVSEIILNRKVQNA